MEIKSTQPAKKGPEQMFTGEAWIETVHIGEEPSRIRFNKVRFSPGARTAWHSHILGQTLFVIDGIGRVQARGAHASDTRAGDVIYTPPGEEHWHGAAPEHSMTHLSVTEWDGDPNHVETAWGDHVMDIEYRA